MIRRWLRYLIGEDPLVEYLMNEIESLKNDRARLEDLLLQKVGLLSKEVLPGVEGEMTPIHVPSRRQVRLEMEEKYRQQALKNVETLKEMEGK